MRVHRWDARYPKGRQLSRFPFDEVSVVIGGMKIATVLTTFSVVLGVSSFVDPANCQERDLRGTTTPSVDGGTYFVLADTSGCKSVLVDGKKWSYAIGMLGPIGDGKHSIACGDPDLAIEFEVPLGKTYGFDYWWP